LIRTPKTKSPARSIFVGQEQPPKTIQQNKNNNHTKAKIQNYKPHNTYYKNKNLSNTHQTFGEKHTVEIIKKHEYPQLISGQQKQQKFTMDTDNKSQSAKYTQINIKQNFPTFYSNKVPHKNERQPKALNEKSTTPPTTHTTK